MRPVPEVDTVSDGLTLRLARRLPASRSVVWKTLTDAEVLAGWWGPKGFTVPRVEFEPHVGEHYRITMQPPEGDPFHLYGEFRAVDPPSVLTYTFAWDPSHPDDRETLVTLALVDRGEETDVELTHGEFATEERLALHDGGWTESFEKLEEVLG
jgi:uncharacterized protein YndB with AHSA1/START domain